MNLNKNSRVICRIVYVFRNFSLIEKVSFFVLAIVFMATSITAVWKFTDKYFVETPANGGILSEGIIGTPRFINPLLAISDADRDMSSLIYSGLLRPDENGELAVDLAEKYEISEDGLSYTFTLKPNLEWQDNTPLTTDDIIFTIQQAKNSDTKSQRRASWEGVEAEKIDNRVVKFTLKKPYAQFLENTTMGILPKHIWQEAGAEQMILSDFNTRPIGSGPYKINKINRNSSGIAVSYELIPNTKFALGKPMISNLIMRFYQSEKDLLKAYDNGDIDSINSISPQMANEIKKETSVLKTLSLPRVFGVFFNQNNAKIFSQIEIRKALNDAVDKTKIIDDVFRGFGSVLDNPIPQGSFGALPKEIAPPNTLGASTTTTAKIIATTTEPIAIDIEKIKNSLVKNGWEFNDGEKVWIKKGAKKTESMRFEFSLATADAPDLKHSAELLKSMWEKIGAKVNLKIYEIGDLNQNIIRPRKYEALLFGEIVGRDPNPFAFWHSSQRNDPGLNIALYANIRVDKILDEARSITDEKLREAKYQEFQTELAKDIPAIFLYSPKFIYLTPSNLQEINKAQNIVIPSERFSQIHKWYLTTNKIWKIFAR